MIGRVRLFFKQRGYVLAKFTVDVVMPFHRCDDLLLSAIRNLENSVGVKLRIILVDDRPPNEDKLPIDLANKVYLATRGVGYSRAVREGLAQVQSDFFAFMDSDDLSSNERLAYQLSDLRESGSDISICAMKYINQTGRRKLIQPPIFQDSTIFKLTNLLGSINSNSTWLCRSEVLNDPKFMPKGYSSIDWATSLQLNADLKIKIIPNRLYSYRQHCLQSTKSSEYVTKAFDEIFPLWSTVNSNFNLPTLSREEAQIIAAPWSLNVMSAKFPHHWLEELLLSKAVSLSTDRIAFYQMATRRYIQYMKRCVVANSN